MNIVGTGGGPPTFNISTASAFVAAAMGVPVVKTGSRAYTSRCGSIDLLHRLGIPLTSSAAMTADMLDRFGVAFAGQYVYPPELVLLARIVLPLDMKRLGRCLNLLGPFLADVPVATQVTGLSDAKMLPLFRALAASRPARQFWFCVNDMGADELLSITPNTIATVPAGSDDKAEPLRLIPERLGLAGGTLDALRPADEETAIVPHVLAILAGDAPPAAVDTVCLNAAALAVAGGVTGDWEDALRLARRTVKNGDARRLVDDMRNAAAPARRKCHG